MGNIPNKENTTKKNATKMVLRLTPPPNKKIKKSCFMRWRKRYGNKDVEEKYSPLKCMTLIMELYIVTGWICSKPEHSDIETQLTHSCPVHLQVPYLWCYLIWALQQSSEDANTNIQLPKKEIGMEWKYCGNEGRKIKKESRIEKQQNTHLITVDN